MRIRLEHRAQPRACQLKGELLARRGAREEHGKSFKPRAAMSLARMLRREGRREEARSTLVDVYGWFTEGFDAVDVRQAGALLAELD